MFPSGHNVVVGGREGDDIVVLVLQQGQGVQAGQGAREVADILGDTFQSHLWNSINI
mgnify:CR=1 FL=1